MGKYINRLNPNAEGRYAAADGNLVWSLAIASEQLFNWLGRYCVSFSYLVIFQLLLVLPNPIALLFHGSDT
jgi:hypothetical protein